MDTTKPATQDPAVHVALVNLTFATTTPADRQKCVLFLSDYIARLETELAMTRAAGGPVQGLPIDASTKAETFGRPRAPRPVAARPAKETRLRRCMVAPAAPFPASSAKQLVVVSESCDVEWWEEIASRARKEPVHLVLSRGDFNDPRGPNWWDAAVVWTGEELPTSLEPEDKIYTLVTAGFERRNDGCAQVEFDVVAEQGGGANG